MEFKQPNRYGRVQPRPNVAPRSNPAPVVTQPILQPTPTKSHKKIFIIIGLSAALVIAAATGFLLYQNSLNNIPNTVLIENPGYTTILPEGSSIKKLGGWERISPPGSDPVFAYADTIKGVSLSVSEQPLPASFSVAPDQQLAELAKAYSATHKINADGIVIYIGTSAKGPQSTLFTKKNLLVLIKSQQKISDEDWVKYITSLN